MDPLDSEDLFANHAFENALPIPEVIDATNGRNITLQVHQISQFLGLYDSDGNPAYTTVWGYGTGIGNTSYPGPTILAYEGVTVTVHWQNKLPLTGHFLPDFATFRRLVNSPAEQRLCADSDPPSWWA
jgi:spore coat protein A, manganese oxidase